MLRVMGETLLLRNEARFLPPEYPFANEMSSTQSNMVSHETVPVFISCPILWNQSRTGVHELATNQTQDR